MRSTFMGLETARRGMFTQQGALYTTGHNISNANTPGYSRQRVNFQQTEPYPAASMNRPLIPGQMGTGVEAGSIQRLRDDFLDTRFRSENSKLGYYGSKSDALTRMEDVMNEPTEEGLSAAIDNFWNSLQTLGTYPNESGARESVLAQANSLADTFNFLSSSLESIRSDLNQNISVNIDSVNTLASQLNSINKQISEVEPHGDLPNDLYDERDRIIDELSKLVKIKITKQPSGGLASPISEGIYKIDIVDSAENSLGTLVDKTTMNSDPNKVSVVINNNVVESLAIGSSGNINTKDFASGSLKGDIESFGFVNKTGGLEGDYPKMIENLDKLAFVLVKEFNSVHSSGVDLQGNAGVNFFNNLSDYKDAAKNISVTLTDPGKIAAALTGSNEGNGENAYNIAEVLRKDFSTFSLKDTIQNDMKMSGNIKSFYGGLITSLGVQTREANVLKNNTQTLTDSVDYKRQSVSGVSLDEEMTNLIKFQHAYNASARNITIVDEMLDKIINGMGVSGR